LNALDELNWITIYSEKGMQAGHFALWTAVLEKPGLPAEMNINRAICLRHLTEFAAAAETLEDVIRFTGASGDFGQQSRAILELAITFRYMGRYRDALKSLSQLRSGNHHLDLAQRVATEQAQIALDQGDMQNAQSILENQPRTLANLVLLSEISAASGAFYESQRFIDMAILQAQQAQSLGRLHAASARIHARQDHYDEAERGFLSAMALMEENNDVFALARCQANLAALLIEADIDYAYAEQLLFASERQQIIMDDQVGLLYTKHNIETLYRKLAIDEQ
jgi:tetratricopeptide (TPR) repeat protein